MEQFVHVFLRIHLPTYPPAVRKLNVDGNFLSLNVYITIPEVQLLYANFDRVSL